MGYVFDTSVVICLRDGDKEVIAREEALARSVAISLVTVIELQGGLVTKPLLAARRRAATQRLLSRYDVLALSGEVVEVYGEMLGIQGFSRKLILDRLIAATALVHDLTLITINGADFRNIPGLRLEVWPKPLAQ